MCTPRCLKYFHPYETLDFYVASVQDRKDSLMRISWYNFYRDKIKKKYKKFLIIII